MKWYLGLGLRACFEGIEARMDTCFYVSQPLAAPKMLGSVLYIMFSVGWDNGKNRNSNFV